MYTITGPITAKKIKEWLVAGIPAETWFLTEASYMEFFVVSVAPGQVSFGVLNFDLVNYHCTYTRRIHLSHCQTTSILTNASVFKQNTRKEEEKGRTVPRPSEYSLNTFHIMLLHLLDLSGNKNNAIMSI